MFPYAGMLENTLLVVVDVFLNVRQSKYIKYQMIFSEMEEVIGDFWACCVLATFKSHIRRSIIIVFGLDISLYVLQEYISQERQQHISNVRN